MAWSPPTPAQPPAGWWTELPTDTDRWVEGIADGLRAERIERLQGLCHEVYMRAAGALSADRWERMQRRRDGDPRDVAAGLRQWQDAHPQDDPVGRELCYHGGGPVLGVH